MKPLSPEQLQSLVPMIPIEGGTFQMGATPEQIGAEPDEQPGHIAHVKDYLLAKYALTFQEYDLFCEATHRPKPHDQGWGRADRPVINITWYDAIEYCNWLSQKTGLQPCYIINRSLSDPHNRSLEDFIKWIVIFDQNKNGFRLPTEQEWEFAARERGHIGLFGANKNAVTLEQYNYNPTEEFPYAESGIYRQQTLPVRSFQPNSLGLYQMQGNALEWCFNWKEDYPNQNKSYTYPFKGKDDGLYRVCRGGAWLYSADGMRNSSRFGATPGRTFKTVGLRLARNPS